MEYFNFAYIINPERQKWFQEIFGTSKIPIRSPFPHQGKKPDGTAGSFYEMHPKFLKEFSQEKRNQLIENIKSRFQLNRGYIEQNLDKIGIPILADDVMVEIAGVWFV